MVGNHRHGGRVTFLLLPNYHYQSRISSHSLSAKSSASSAPRRFDLAKEGGRSFKDQVVSFKRRRKIWRQKNLDQRQRILRLFRTWRGTLHGRPGTGCPSYGKSQRCEPHRPTGVEEMSRKMRDTVSETLALQYEEAAASSSSSSFLLSAFCFYPLFPLAT